MKQEVAKFYEDTRSYYAAYHDHKENAAWGGLVLYVLFCGVLIRLENGNAPITNNFLDIAVSAVVVLAAMIVFFYVKNQLALKAEGAALAAASTLLLVEVILEEEGEFDAGKYMKVTDSAETSRQAPHCLPEILWRKSRLLETRGGGAARLGKMLVYSILVTITIGVIISRWVG